MSKTQPKEELLRAMGADEAQTSADDSPAVSATLHSTSQFGNSAPLNWQAMCRDVLACQDVIVLSAFYTKKMLRQLAIGRTVRILLNGLSEQKLRTQVDDLAELEQELREGGRQAEVRLAFSPGVFHPKIFLFGTENNSWTAWIGSANATSAALGDQTKNEEVMLRLNPAPHFIVEYAKSAWESARPIRDCKAPVNSLSALFQTGVLYYEPYNTNLPFAVNPFLRLLRLLERDEKERLVAFRHPLVDEPNGIGAFNIGRVYKNERTRNADDEIENRRVAVRPYAVETCYGLWVSSPYIGTVDSSLDRASRERDAFYQELRDWLKEGGRTIVVREFVDYLSAVRETMDTHDVNWQLALERGKAANPFGNSAPIERRIDVVIASLSDDARRQKLCRAYVKAAVPSFNDDAEAASEFERTFFESLEVQSFDVRRKSSAAKRFFNAGIAEQSTAEEIRINLEEKLVDEGWYRGRFLLQ